MNRSFLLDFESKFELKSSERAFSSGMMCTPCLVPRPHYSARPKRFGSRGPMENVRPFPDRSPRIRHRNELTERDWENAVQGLGKCTPTTVCDI